VCDCKCNLCIVSCASLTGATSLSADRGYRGFRLRAMSSLNLVLTLYVTLYTEDSFVMNALSFSFIPLTLHHLVIPMSCVTFGVVLRRMVFNSRRYGT
jgi:hypothetical protein